MAIEVMLEIGTHHQHSVSRGGPRALLAVRRSNHGARGQPDAGFVPIARGVAFLTTSPNPFAAAVMGWSTGENMLDVAAYINDARSLRLVLCDGQTGAEVEGHDWERILKLTGALHRDHQAAGVVQFAGAVRMIGSLACATL
jgi:hypothetical protein